MVNKRDLKWQENYEQLKDYVVKYRQKDMTKASPSVIIKLTMKNEIQIIRK